MNVKKKITDSVKEEVGSRGIIKEELNSSIMITNTCVPGFTIEVCKFVFGNPQYYQKKFLIYF